MPPVVSLRQSKTGLRLNNSNSRLAEKLGQDTIYCACKKEKCAEVNCTAHPVGWLTVYSLALPASIEMKSGAVICPDNKLHHH